MNSGLSPQAVLPLLPQQPLPPHPAYPSQQDNVFPPYQHWQHVPPYQQMYVTSAVYIPPAPPKVKPVYPILRWIHPLITLICAAVVFGGSLYVSLFSSFCGAIDCLTTTLLNIPFLVIAPCAIMVALVDVTMNIKKRPSTPWLIWENVLGFLAWGALTAVAGLITFAIIGTAKKEMVCKARSTSFRLEDLVGIPGIIPASAHFFICVFGDLSFAMCVIALVNYLWGIGLWIMCRSAERKRASERVPMSTHLPGQVIPR